MRSIYKYLAHAGFVAAMCIWMTIPATAQHRGGGGGGGGHAGGFSGGGHAGGFSGGSSFSGSHFNGNRGFSGGSHVGSAPRMSTGIRPAMGARAGSIAPRGYVRSVTAAPRGLANRGYIAGAGVYGHSYAGGGIYARPYAWGHHGGYFYTRGYYGSLYYPWLGFGYAYLPYGYYPFWWDNAWFYYSDGFYYQYNNDQYTVVEPPVGAALKKLPDGAKSIVIDGQQYYELNGVYYEPVTQDNGEVVYQIAGKDGVLNTGSNGNVASVTPKVGDVTYTLPDGCKKVKLNGQTLYVSDDGIYYQQIKDESGKKAYKIVALEDDGQQQ